MTPEFIRPNLHVALIHYPLGLLVLGVIIETFSFLWRRSTVRQAGLWMILFGALLGIPAAFTGMYALADLGPTLTPAAQVLLRQHVLFQSCATGAAAIAAVLWLGGSDRWRRAMHVPLLVIVIASVAAMMVGAWFGGEAIYQHGAGVHAAEPPAATDSDAPQSNAAPCEPRADVFSDAASLAIIGQLFADATPADFPAALPTTTQTAPIPLQPVSAAIPTPVTTPTPAASNFPALLTPQSPATLPLPVPPAIVGPPPSLNPSSPVMALHPAPPPHANTPLQNEAASPGGDSQLASILPPLEAHLLAASVAIAFGLVALALAHRRIAVQRTAERDARASVARAAEERQAAARNPAMAAGMRRVASDPLAMMQTLRPGAAVVLNVRTVPAARFWLIAAGFLVLAASAGWWTIAHDDDVWARTTPAISHGHVSAAQHWKNFASYLLDDAFARDRGGQLVRRRAAFHTINGVVLIGTSLLLAALSRWAKRQRALLWLVGLLLLASVAAQIWLGVLMLFESPRGPVTHFLSRSSVSS